MCMTRHVAGVKPSVWGILGILERLKFLVILNPCNLLEILEILERSDHNVERGIGSNFLEFWEFLWIRSNLH